MALNSDDLSFTDSSQSFLEKGNVNWSCQTSWGSISRCYEIEIHYNLLTLTFLRLPVGNLPSHYLPLTFIYSQPTRYIHYFLSAAFFFRSKKFTLTFIWAYLLLTNPYRVLFIAMKSRFIYMQLILLLLWINKIQCWLDPKCWPGE